MRSNLLILAVVPLLALAASPAPTRSSEDVAALVKRQSQGFSDASASGNVAVLAHYLDDNVTFMDENGELGTKKDLLAGTAPTPKGVSTTLRQTDWHYARYGSVASPLLRMNRPSVSTARRSSRNSARRKCGSKRKTAGR